MATDPRSLDIIGVHKSFGPTSVLRGVDLQAAPGTLTAVLGPSGCGKTTLLRIIAGFETADTGTVRLGDRTLVGRSVQVPSQHRRIGLMPQEGALFPHLDVAGNVAFGLPGRQSRAQRRQAVEQWLDLVGLPGVGRARPHELSGGQQQRVALARALAADPQVVLLDEPFAALDAALRTKVREEIAWILADAGTTAVLVTHDQAEALSLADRVALLIDGEVAQWGPPTELYQRPSSVAAARFLGETVELAGTASGGVVRSALGAHAARLPVPDGPVTVLLRPEQLWLHPDSGVPATVTEQRFYGPDSAVHVRLSDSTPLTLRAQGSVAVAAGTPVTVLVMGDVLAYPTPSAADHAEISADGVDTPVQHGVA